MGREPLTTASPTDGPMQGHQGVVVLSDARETEESLRGSHWRLSSNDDRHHLRQVYLSPRPREF